MRLIDSHCHLDAPAFDRDRAAVIARAQDAGVVAQIVPAVSAARWEHLRNTCTLAPHLFPAYGLHPMFVAEHRPSHLDALRQWIERERPLALGECGLDYFAPGLDQETQMLYFDAQLKLAREHDLPLIIHARRALDAVIARLRRIGGLRGVVHSFSGSLQQARQLSELGFLLGLGGPMTYPRAQRLRRVAAKMPLESLLLETDAPDQPDTGIPRQRNEPARLPAIASILAQVRQQPVAEVARATTVNALRLFKLPLDRAHAITSPTPFPLPQMQTHR